MKDPPFFHRTCSNGGHMLGSQDGLQQARSER